MEGELKLSNLNKSRGKLEIFRDFSLSFREGEINCILGPSGCGKTTLLDIISGLTEAEPGFENPFLSHTISFVFQEPRLLPWKTVEENLSFILKTVYKGEELKQKVKEYLQMVELESFSAYYPHELSGGMKQRLSLARAFSYPSDVILMDEAFKALDLKLKNNLTEGFLRLWKKDKRTVIFVTHDVDEALRLGNTIFVFSSPPVAIQGIFTNQDKDEKLRNMIIDILEQ